MDGGGYFITTGFQKTATGREGVVENHVYWVKS